MSIIDMIDLTFTWVTIRLLGKIHKQKEPPIEIPTPWGNVTEAARLRAALNMRDDPLLLLRVESLVIKECGGDVDRGRAESRRRYPEAYK